MMKRFEFSHASFHQCKSGEGADRKTSDLFLRNRRHFPCFYDYTHWKNGRKLLFKHEP